MTPSRGYYLWTTALLSLLACACQAMDPTPSAASQPATQPATIPYELAKAHIAFAYPATWQPITGITTLTIAPVAGDNGGQRYIEFDYPDLPPHIPGMISVGMVQGGFVNDLKHRASNVKVMDAPFKLAGVSAKIVQASAVQDKNPLAITAILAVRNDRVYVFDAESDPDFAADAKAALMQIVASVRWTK